MIWVRDLDRSLDFYEGKLGMRLLRRRIFPEGRFTLVLWGMAMKLTIRSSSSPTIGVLTTMRSAPDLAI
jgi:catechol 2,3-dioxygenase-like lactoylglutathione lyase family enzyme